MHNDSAAGTVNTAIKTDILYRLWNSMLCPTSAEENMVAGFTGIPDCLYDFFRRVLPGMYNGTIYIKKMP